MVSLGIFMVPSSSSIYILTSCLNSTEVGLIMEADRIVQVDRTSIMEALWRKKSWASLGVTPSSKRLWLSEASMKKRREIRGSTDKE